MTSASPSLWIPQRARADAMFKKASPRTGPQHGTWAGRDLTYLNFPGGAALAFDLSKLTLADYRTMREHYQVNASQSLLMFMMHQQDWQIDSDDARVARRVDDVLRPVWTRLVRGLSQAFWAGFSPNVIEYDNDGPGKRVIISKVKDLVPEECRVNWKVINGAPAVPGGAPIKLNEYNGLKQTAYGVGGGSSTIDPEYTLWYPVMMENGNYYGKKLLKPAFVPWFFSQLIHLFTNRYYERFGEPVPIGRADFEDTVIDEDGNEINGRTSMENVLTNLRNRGVVVLPSDRVPTGDGTRSEYAYDIDYLECVDTETEILTSSGWRTWDGVTVGDLVYTLNHDTGHAGWQPVQKMNVHEAVDREMLAMEGTVHSSLTTLNHRWPTLHQNSRDWRTSSTLRQRDRIPLIADRCDFPSEAKYDDAFVELVAWYWTEGYTYERDGERINYISITQKKYPELIRSALTRLFGTAVDRFPRHAWNYKRDGIARWRENCKTGDESVRQFFLNYEISESLQAVAPDRIVTHEFLLALTKAQLDLYIKTALLADGNVTARQSFLMQRDRRKAEMFQFACVMAGHATSIYPQREKRHVDYWMWVVSIRRSTVFHPKNAADGSGSFKMSRVRHDGVVWCPTTENGTWLARRRGTVYFTGNSQMRGADWERYLLRLDEEISLGLFTPLSALRIGENGGMNQVQVHLQVFLWQLNAFAGDWKEYIDRYVVQRIVDWNFGPRAARAEWCPKKFGKDNAETLRAVALESIRIGDIRVDPVELGEAIGLSVEDVSELVRPGDLPAAGVPTAGPTPGGKPRVDIRTSRGSHQDRKVPKTGDSGVIRHKVAERLTAQFHKAKFANQDQFEPDIGFGRQIEDYVGDADEADAILRRLDTWARETYPIVDLDSEFCSLVENVLEHALA